MKFFATTILVSLASTAAPAQQVPSALPQDMRMEFNNFSHELQQCHVYNVVSAQCFGDKMGAASSSQVKATANAFNEMAINSGKMAGLSPTALLARTEILTSEMIGDIDNDCVNISVLLNKYAKTCKALMETSNERIARILDRYKP